jgi:hypothetical protein
LPAPVSTALDPVHAAIAEKLRLHRRQSSKFTYETGPRFPGVLNVSQTRAS